MRLQLPNLRCTIKLKGVIFNSASKAFLLNALGKRGLDGCLVVDGLSEVSIGSLSAVYGAETRVFGKTDEKAEVIFHLSCVA